ncbi:hypothetical protein NDU88_001336 [Pleurodeles waltl]|uniref:Uncharacterized protein n=1 Tax=Pleurodeles waltl TaxID=8319 RepID=A0AAV7R6S4_PLEWA|nr:hypothetical protein NDU88_001336 [Pleurodeles waltl]
MVHDGAVPPIPGVRRSCGKITGPLPSAAQQGTASRGVEGTAPQGAAPGAAPKGAASHRPQCPFHMHLQGPPGRPLAAAARQRDSPADIIRVHVLLLDFVRCGSAGPV